MRSFESAGSVSIFEGAPGAAGGAAKAADERTRDRPAAARRTRMGTPSGETRDQGDDSGTPGGFAPRASRIRAEVEMNESPVAAFRALHAAGCFVVPNPWDAGSAVVLESLGFKALATTSAGFAFTKGLPDTVTAVSRDAMLAHVREIAEATPLPVTADFQSGYAAAPEDVAANVALCVATGAAGL